MFIRTLAVAFIAQIALLATSVQAIVVPAPPAVAAESYILVDANSGEIIVEENADLQLPPASLTKLMTSYVLSHELEQGTVRNEDLATVSRKAWAQNPVFKGSSLMWIEIGKKVSLGDLHKGIVVSSGNDASVAVAEHLAGSEAAFAEIMNEHAARLGFENTHYVNSHGLPAEGHYTSARDLVKMTKAILAYPEEYSLYKLKEFEYNGIRQTNRNRLLWADASVDGLKTGHTERAGYCLVSSAKRDEMRLISVVMGAQSDGARLRETKKLLNYGFRYFETKLFANAGDKLSVKKIWKGNQDSVELGVGEDIFLTVPRGKHDELQVDVKVSPVLVAPFTKGQKMGDLIVKLDDKIVGEHSLIALENVGRGGIFKRMWHSVLLYFRQLIYGDA